MKKPRVDALTVNSIVEIESNKNKTSQIAKNLNSLLSAQQITENEIAQSLNIPVMTIRRLVSGETIDPRISTLKLIADFFSISVDSLIEDNSSRSISQMHKTNPQFVPILDWKLATTINSISDIDLTSWKEWHPVIRGVQTELSNDAFGLESRPSMQPRFPTGTLFIIDPKEIPADGDIVLVKMKTDGNLSLRELNVDAPRWQLQPIVPGSEVFFYDKKQHHFMGVVVLTFLHSKK